MYYVLPNSATVHEFQGCFGNIDDLSRGNVSVKAALQKVMCEITLYTGWAKLNDITNFVFLTLF